MTAVGRFTLIPEAGAKAGGECVEKKCAALNYNAGGGVYLKFPEVMQNSGRKSIKCPNTHTGKVTLKCNKGATGWAYHSGSCREKKCSAKRVNPGINFPAVKQGTGRVTRNCPSGWSGSVSLTCNGASDSYTSQSGGCKRNCPRFSGWGKANWWGSLDRTGWSLAAGPMTGLYRTSGHWLWNIEESGYYGMADNHAGYTCTNVNWWSSFDRRGWSTCPHGYFMHGLYRTGHIGWWARNQLYHIESAHCCKPRNTKGYGRCYNANWWHSFDRRGWSSCAGGYAMVGMYRNWCHQIYCLESVKCCQLPSTCS